MLLPFFIPLESFFWHDKIPYDVARPTTLTTGTYSARLNYRILYKTNCNTSYYDIAAIGYLHAVQRYFTEKSLHRYRFSTIAWRSMNSSLNTFRRQEQRRQSHEFSYQAAHPPPDDAFDALRARLLLHDLFLLADEEQALLIRHRLHGCSLAETARREGMSVKRVRHRLKALYRAYFTQKENKQKEL